MTYEELADLLSDLMSAQDTITDCNIKAVNFGYYPQMAAEYIKQMQEAQRTRNLLRQRILDNWKADVQKGKLEYYTTITRSGCTQNWLEIDGLSYRIGGAVADALVEAGTARLNPFKCG